MGKTQALVWTAGIAFALACSCTGEGPPVLVDPHVIPSPTVPAPAITPPTLASPVATPSPTCDDATAAEAVAAPATVQIIAGTTAGSGVIVSAQGQVLTAYHVVQGQRLVVVLLPDGRRTVGTMVAGDEASDLALVTIPLQGLPALSWATAEPAPGTRVLALGYPLPSARGLGGRPAVTATETARAIEAGGQRFLPLATALDEGYSGGPAVDLCGRLVGLVLARLAGGDDLALVLSSVRARPVAERLAAAKPPPLDPEMRMLAANMSAALAEGYLPTGRYAAVDAGGERLFALHSICLDSADSYCQKVLFFLDTRYVGPDTFRPSRSILDVVPGPAAGEVTVYYANYAPGDPDCCPSGPPVPIPYFWDGQRLRTGGAPPGH